MAIIIDNSNSIADGGLSLDGTDTTIIVAPEGYIYDISGVPIGALQLANAAYTVTINGIVGSTAFSTGIVLSNPTGTSKLTVGAAGEVFGGATGLYSGHTLNLTNSGLIRGGGFYGVLLIGSGDCTIVNKAGAEIIGVNSGIFFDRIGTNTLVNAGSVTGSFEAIRTSSFDASVEQIKNSGVLNGDVFLGLGNDVFTNFQKIGTKVRAGTVIGTIDLGQGNDTFRGGSKAEIVRDGLGADIYKFGGGNDTYIAAHGGGTDGADTVAAGAGIDLYDASLSNSGANINLDTIAHDVSTFGGPGFGFVDAVTASGPDLAGTSRDMITGFENAKGGAGNDFIHGNAAANQLEGGGGTDWLLGYGGNDTLIGGSGVTALVGGSGRDMLFGGTGADYFTFWKATDSGPTRATRDVITDFADGTDFISLDKFDANTTNAKGTNDAFTFIGTNMDFHHQAGELRVNLGANGEIVQGDINGDGKTDFSIEVIDHAHSITFTSGDFFL
jgi:Ca2+-binding RTX toxin-like protein